MLTMRERERERERAKTMPSTALFDIILHKKFIATGT
jgi:hypothetical protein